MTSMETAWDVYDLITNATGTLFKAWNIIDLNKNRKSQYDSFDYDKANELLKSMMASLEELTNETREDYQKHLLKCYKDQFLIKKFSSILEP